MTGSAELSVIVPCFNEEKNLPSLVARLDETMRINGIAVEIVLVDDCSRDRTRARLAANLAWDFQDAKSPLDAAAVDAIVDKIFNGKSEPAPGRAAPRGKGGPR